MKRAILCFIFALAVGSFALAAGAESVDDTDKDPGSASSNSGKARKGAGVLGFVSDEDIEITADHIKAEMLPNGKRVVYDTNVKAEQGDLTLTCDHLELLWLSEKRRSRARSAAKGPMHSIEDLSNLESIAASGNVKIVQGDIMAVSGEALYDHAKGTFTLKRGNSPGPLPSLWQGRDSIVADTIIFYIHEGRMEMRRGKQKRIRTIIRPARQKREK